MTTPTPNPNPKPPTASDRARALIRAGYPTAEIAAATGLRATSVNRLRRRMACAAPRGRTPAQVPAEAIAACQAGESARSVAPRFNLTPTILRRACKAAGVKLPKRPPPVQRKKTSPEPLRESEG